MNQGVGELLPKICALAVALIEDRKLKKKEGRDGLLANNASLPSSVSVVTIIKAVTFPSTVRAPRSPTFQGLR